MAVGTIDVTNSSTNVSGTNTTFLTDFKSGDYILFVIGGTTYSYPVISVQSDISLTLVDPFDGPTSSNLSYSNLPDRTMVSIPIALINQTTLAIRGLNQDKENWQQVYSSADQITVTLPDGSTFSGPSWLQVVNAIDATNLDAITAVADRMDADVQEIEGAFDELRTIQDNITQNATDAKNAATDAATSASSAADFASASSESETNAANSATEAAASAAGIGDELEQATAQADRAKTEADKLGNVNDFAAILDTINIDNADVTFKGNVAGADAVNDNDFVTLSQLNISMLHQPLNANTFDDLATLIPAEEGHLAFLREYHSGTGFGGGMFIAVEGSATSDGGLIQAVNDDFHWQRYIDPAQADVTMFGAIADGQTDCADAVEAMFNWYTNSGNIYQRIGIQFPAGEFALSSIPASTTQITMFRCVGLGHDQLGYNNATRLWLIGDADSICFDVVARWTEIGNFQIQGDGLSNDTVVRHFFRNSVTQGQHVRVFNLYIQDVYGRMFQLIDSLDSKFSQVYAQRGHDNLIRCLASGELSWDHSTAIEISNCTLQHFSAESDQGGVFFIPNCTQAMMWNVWIEYCDYPGNLTNGEWALHSLAMESNVNPLYMGQTRLAQYSCSNANGAGIDILTDKSVNNITGEPESNALSQFEAGQVLIYSHGVYANAAFQASLHYSAKIFSNSGSGSAVWVRIGYFVGSATAETFRIHIVTRNGFSTPNATRGGLDGDCVITIQNRSATTDTVSWHGQSVGSGILAVRYEKPFATDTAVYVQLAGFSRMGVTVHTTGTTRLDAGEHSYVNWDMSTISSDDLNAIDGLLTPLNLNSWGTTTAGLIADGDNNILDIRTTSSVENNTNKISIRVNGTDAKIPYQTNGFVNIGHWRVADLLASEATLGDITTVNTFTDEQGVSHVQQAVKFDGTNWKTMDGQFKVVGEGNTPNT